MNTSQLSQLSDHELTTAYKKAKSRIVINTFLMGTIMGVTLYGYIKNGFSFFTVMPLIFIAHLHTLRKDFNVVSAEVKIRTKNQQDGVV